jgi:hypothetical protein
VGSTSATGRNPDEAPTTIQIGEGTMMLWWWLYYVTHYVTFFVARLQSLPKCRKMPQNAAKRNQDEAPTTIQIGEGTMMLWWWLYWVTAKIWLNFRPQKFRFFLARI